jgi:hypothetical protein
MTAQQLAFTAILTFNISIVNTASLHHSTGPIKTAAAYATSTTWKFAVARQSFPGSTLILRLVMAFSTHTKRS